MTCEAYQDLIAAHVDGQLTTAEARDVDEHLSFCAHCREQFTEAQRFRTAFAARRVLLVTPPAVEEQLRLALAREVNQERSSWNRFRVRLTTLPRVFRTLSFATAAAFVFLVLTRLIAREPDLLAVATEQYQIATADQRVFAYVTRDPHMLEQHLNSSKQLDFTMHVLDLRPFGYRIRGGNIARLNGHPTAITVYRGTEGDLVCLRQRGPLPPLPPGAEHIGHDHVYTYGEYTIILIQETDRFCVLVSHLPRDVFLRTLGYTKP